MAPLLICRAHLQCSNQLAVAFQVGFLQHAGLAMIGPMGRMGFMDEVRRPVYGAGSHTIQLR